MDGSNKTFEYADQSQAPVYEIIFNHMLFLSGILQFIAGVGLHEK